jgi:hypothetical protein
MAYYKPLPPVAELKRLLALRSDGKLIWKRPTSIRAKAGTEAGCFANGYIKIGIHGIGYQAHRVVWVLAHGFDPGTKGIDHIDGDRSNNRLSNLRLCNQSQNCLNTKISPSNKSGVKGVCYDPSSSARPWRAYVQRRKLGRFETKDAALEALQAEIEQMPDGSFYRFDFLH